MYIGPQGIVHGTTITMMNAFRKVLKKDENPAGKIFLTAGLGGMSGAQPKAGNIAGCITICAEVNPKAATKRHEQGWVDVLIDDIDDLVIRVQKAQLNDEVVSIAFIGNVVDVWERFDNDTLRPEIIVLACDKSLQSTGYARHPLASRSERVHRTVARTLSAVMTPTDPRAFVLQ